MNYRRVTQFPATLSDIADAISGSTVLQGGLPAGRSAVRKRPPACSRRAAASSGLQPCGISIAFLRLPPGALQRVAELFFAAAAKPSQYIFAAPNKLGIDCLDIDHETFVNPAKPNHDQRRQEVERHPLRSAGLHSRRTRDRFGTGVKPDWTIGDSPSFASVFYWLFSVTSRVRVCHSGCKTHMAPQRIRHNICPLFL